MVCSPENATSTKPGSEKSVSWESFVIPQKRTSGRGLQWSYSIKVAGLLSRSYKLLKKSSSYISRGVFESLGKLSNLSNSICSIYHSQLYWKPTPLQMHLLSVKRLIKIAGKSPAVESIFSKVTGEISY